MYAKNNECCYVEMPKEDNEILKYNHGENSMKVEINGALWDDLDQNFHISNH